MILLVLALGGWCVTLNSNLQDDQLIVGRKYVYPSNYQQSGYVGSWEPWWQCLMAQLILWNDLGE